MPDSRLPKSRVPPLRVRAANLEPVRADGSFVLYWMIAARRTHHNFGLERAAEWARSLGKPLVVLEALRVGYPWASDRLHQFVMTGMADNARRLGEAGVVHHAYVEPQPGAGKGLLSALAARAAVVVTDEYPAFFLPHMVAAAGKKLPVLLEEVDSNGLLPLHAPDKAFTAARFFRGYLQKNLLPHLRERPLADPLAARLPPAPKGLLPADLLARWPRASDALLAGEGLSALPIDHTVKPAPLRGGPVAAGEVLERFVKQKLARYTEDRNEPDHDGTSRLSPYLHFGHISAHEVFERVAREEGWAEGLINPRAAGSREGFWGMRPPAEEFLDQLVTWREIGFNMCALRPHDHDRYESLPDWARATLEKHANDPRPHLYTLEELSAARTGDRVWNAAQRELLCEGRINNYLRMLWGKRVLEWTRTPREALSVLIELNNRYALDGRDPNSYSGIFWVLGRYDRPWAPERPIYGSVRYMSSANTEKKLDLKRYLVEYGSSPQQRLLG
jgi:deoxyribodipyrimidine photo-lyase